MPAVNIAFSDAGHDLLTYLADWVSPDPVSANGAFSGSTQWAGGDDGGSTNAVLLQGNSFAYPAPGGFTGNVDTLTFGDGLSGSAGTGFSIDDTELVLGLGGGAATTPFKLAIRGLQLGDEAALIDYFDASGTVQHSSSGDDILYGFAAVDTFVFGSTSIGEDFVVSFDAGSSSTTVDEITFDTSVFTDWFDVLNSATDTGTDVEIEYSAGNIITLIDVDLADLNANDFNFV
jgi:hypothetical protein